MRTCIILFVATLATFTVAEFALHGDLKDASEKCIASTGVEEDLITRARKNDFVEDEKLMNYCTCVLQKRGTQNPDGSFNVDVMKNKIPEGYNKEKALKAIDQCTKIDVTTPAKTAYEAVKCFIPIMLGKA